MQQFHLTGAGLGGLAATFYYAYMVTQLFVGFLLDKYSTRRLTSVAIFTSALGILLFAGSQTIVMASIARALMGIGVAFATVSYMKLAAVWFPPKQYAFVSGLLATAAMPSNNLGIVLSPIIYRRFIRLIIFIWLWTWCFYACLCDGKRDEFFVINRYGHCYD